MPGETPLQEQKCKGLCRLHRRTIILTTPAAIDKFKCCLNKSFHFLVCW